MLNTRPQSPTMTTRTEKENGRDDEHSNIEDDVQEEESVPQHHRRARFAVDATDSQSAPHRILTTEMINDLWYAPEEIDEFKHDIRSLVIRQAQKGALEDDEMAGLEKYNHQRSQYKKFAKYHTLNAQSKNRDPEFLRSVSRRFTSWARSVARDQGLHDYYTVYDPLDELFQLENFESTIDEIGSMSVHKRIRGEESSPPSSKRQKLLASS